MFPVLRVCSTFPRLGTRWFSQVLWLDVHTSDIRGAGTEAQVSVNVVGCKGETGSRALMPPSGEFKRNSRERFALDCDDDIGQPVKVDIGHDEGGLGSGWHLDHINIFTLGKRFSFPCHRWLGESDSGGISGTPQATFHTPPALADTMDDQPDHSASTQPPIKLTTSACTLPHPDKVAEGARAVNGKFSGFAGEDSYGVGGGGHVVVVADGVYEWRKKGIDVSKYSRFLTQSVVNNHLHHPSASPRKLMRWANEEVKDTGLQGSSTLVVCVVDPNTWLLRSAILGDSGFMIVRGVHSRSPHIVFRSPQQEHMFGYPYQLGHHDLADSHTDALIFEFPVQHDDVIVVATDGLFDNLSDQDIVDTLVGCLASKSQALPLAARSLAFKAFHNSQLKTASTPYSMAATEEFQMIYNGGKKDDITVIVADVSSP